MDAETKNRLKETLKRAFPYAPDDPALDELVGYVSEFCGSASRLQAGETAAVTFFNQKAAALCYDRVWAFGPAWVPDGIRFGGTTKLELETLGRLAALMSIAVCAGDEDVKAELALEPRHLEFFDSEFTRLAKELADCVAGSASGDGPSSILDAHSRALSDELSCEHGLRAVPLYDSVGARDREFLPGDYSVIVATLTDLNVVSEADATWDQIREFREDPDAKRKYRRLAHWLDASFAGRSFAFVEDEISGRLEDYEWALKRHGFKTVTGCISEALNPKVIAAASTIAGAAAIGGSPGLGALIGAATILGRVGLKIADAGLDVQDAKRTLGREIAFVHEARENLRRRA